MPTDPYATTRGPEQSTIRAGELTVRRGRPEVIHHLSLELGGGVVALVGPNGSGKSTLLRTMATLLAPDSGSLEVCGHDATTATGRRRIRRIIGFMDQDPALPGGRATVSDALEYAAWLHRLGRGTRHAVASVARRLDLGAIRNDRLPALSGGTRQRVSLAQAVIAEPEVLLLDEPTTGIDTEHRAGFRNLLRSIAEHTLVVMATHIAEDVDHLATDVVALRSGRLAFHGTRADLFALAPSGTDRHPFESAMEVLAQRVTV